MESLSIQFQPFFEWLLRTTLQASVLICLILLLQAVLRDKLGVRWHYCLWLVLLVRMAMPWTPASRVSLFNLLPQSMSQRQFKHAKVQSADSIAASANTSESTQVSTTAAAQDSREVVTVTPQIRNETKGQSKSAFFELADILPLVWLAGGLVLGTYVCASNFNLLRIVKRRRPLTDQKILDLLEDCKSQMGIRTILGVVTTDKVKSPALFGFVRPRLLLPEGMIETLDQQELRYILLHELAHLKRHDIYIGWLMSLLQILHWFNPLIWLAFYRMRSDRELACDALVMDRTQSDEPKSYGRIIVNLVERFSRPQRLPGMAGILETKAHLKRRITMIARFKKNSYQWSPLAVVLIIILACVSLPDAKRTKASETSAAKPGRNITLRQVWSGPGVDCYGAPSPDGRYLSYVDWETSDLNHNDLAIYEIATGKKRRLTDNASWYESDEYQFALSSIWSPDGKQIAYQWWSKVIELCVIGIDGSKPRILYGSEEREWVRPYDWTPDGRQILACVAGKDGKNRIVLVSAADGSVRILKTLDKYYGLRDSSWYTPKNMSFSPDGRYIVYDFPQKEDSHDISLMSTDGSREISLVDHAASDYVLGWAPDGRNIIFASDRTGTVRVWLIAVADGKPQGGPELVKADIGRFGPMGLTEDGSFYYSHSPSPYKNDVYITEIDPETGKIVAAPHEAIKTYMESNTTPDYSPDGKYLAYISRRPPPLKMLGATTPLGNVICILSLETGEEREFKPGMNSFGFPQWSPDSRSIMVVNFEDDNKNVGLYRIDAQTGKGKLVVMSEDNKRFYGHLWGADGKFIFIVRVVRTGDQDKHFCQIVIRDIENGVENELYRGGRSDLFSISLSPDGKWLAFLDKGKKRTLRIMPATGGESREIHIFDKEDNRYTPHTWTADGKYILMPKFRPPEADGKWDLWRIPVEEGEPQNFGFEMASILQLSAHPDGQHIAFSTTTSRRAEVWVMKNFLPTTVASAAK